MAKKLDWSKKIEFVDTRYGTVLPAEVVAVVADGSRVIEYEYPRSPSKKYSLICNENGTVVGSSARGLRDYQIRNAKTLNYMHIEWMGDRVTNDNCKVPFISNCHYDSVEHIMDTVPPISEGHQAIRLTLDDGKIVGVEIL